MFNVLAVAAGGAVGAVLRYGISAGVNTALGRGFPYGTLTVNVLGSLIMGVLYVLMIERLVVAAEWRAALLIGVLGALTTFSSFSIETMLLIENGAAIRALLNVVLNVTICLVVCWLGMAIGRQL